MTALAIALLVYQGNRAPHTIEVFSTVFMSVKLGVGLQIDILSTLLLFMATSLGATIGHYADRYLDGELRQQYFYKYLAGIVVSASLLVVSSNLLMFFGMWLAISFNLHKLLVFYSDRPKAVMAARQKAIVSRFGDFALLSAIALIYMTFGSFEFSEIFAKVNIMVTESRNLEVISVIGFLLATGALTKSAQFPFHFWLPETMETPTPVSALMHAGIINAGGILIIRMSPLIQHDILTHILMALVGTISVVFGALCMIVQNDIKKKLAYSTISQMGMMMLACGLGAYSIALFHIFAHSFYKAHAFLSTGKLVEESKKIGFKLKAPSSGTILFAGAAGIVTIGISAQWGGGKYLPIATYCSILFLGLLQNASTLEKMQVSRLRVVSQIVFALMSAITVYAAVEHFLGQQLYLKSLVDHSTKSQFDLYIMTALSIIVFSICLLSVFLCSRLMNINTPYLEKTYVYLRNGGYLGLKNSVFLAKFFPTTKAAR